MFLLEDGPEECVDKGRRGRRRCAVIGEERQRRCFDGGGKFEAGKRPHIEGRGGERKAVKCCDSGGKTARVFWRRREVGWSWKE